MKFCSKCGAQLSDDAVFCSGCGTRMETGGAAPADNGGGSVQPDAPVNGNGGQDLKEVAGNVVTNLTNTVNQAINSEKGQEYLTSSSKLGNIGYVAAVLGAVSVFFPIFSIGGLGGVGTSAMQESKIIGLAIIAVALFGAYGINVKKYAVTLASGQAVLLLGLIAVVVFQKQVSGNFFGKFVGYDLGVYFLLISGVLQIFIAGFMSLADRHIKPDIGLALNEIRRMEGISVEINGTRLNVVVLTVLLLAIVCLSVSLAD